MSVLSTIKMIIWLLPEEKMPVTSNSTPQRQIAVMFSLERMLILIASTTEVLG